MRNDHDNQHGTNSAEAGRHEHGPPRSYTDTGSHALPAGLAVAVNGLRLDPSTIRIDPGVNQEWTFRMHDAPGDIVTAFEETHDQLAHLILVHRDLTRFQHLHPKVGEDGTWSAEFSLPDSGVYRAFVDVLVEGQPTTLGVGLLASGSADYESYTRSTREATVGGYEVVMAPAEIPAGEETNVAFEVRRDGDVARLDPYLGALGHLVVLREGDLAYLHAPPQETDPMDGVVRFAVIFPTPGRYRLFLQAKPRGELITTAFDAQVKDV